MKIEVTITDDSGNVQQYDVIGLLRFIQNNYTYEYSEQVNAWGYKHKKHGWHVFGNVYTEKEMIDDFVRSNNL
jgi:hypothetical protein